MFLLLKGDSMTEPDTLNGIVAHARNIHDRAELIRGASSLMNEKREEPADDPAFELLLETARELSLCKLTFMPEEERRVLYDDLRWLVVTWLAELKKRSDARDMDVADAKAAGDRAARIRRTAVDSGYLAIAMVDFYTDNLRGKSREATSTLERLVSESTQATALIHEKLEEAKKIAAENTLIYSLEEQAKYFESEAARHRRSGTIALTLAAVVLAGTVSRHNHSDQIKLLS